MVSNRVGWRENLHEIIFEADTPAGKLFDVGLLVTIVVSVTAVCLESVPWIDARYHRELLVVEWAITIAFTIEYALRLIAVQRPLAYARSFFGVVDLLAVLPTYLSLFFPGAHTLLVIRALRLLRIFRIFKLARFLSEADILVQAMRRSGRKIVLFLGSVLTLVVIMGALMYLVEGPENGFLTIPIGMYWAVVTVTTVGYGDVSPSTGPGRLLAAVLMLMGYGILAVPTGIFSAELIRAGRASVSTQACLACSAEGHDVDAVYCKFCGEHLGAQGHSQE
jgi:voltage-gated potassium channel